MRTAPAADGRGQPPGWPLRAVQPSQVPHMVHVVQSKKSFPVMLSPLDLAFPLFDQGRGAGAAMRSAPWGAPRSSLSSSHHRATESGSSIIRTSGIAPLFTFPLARSRIIRQGKRRAFTSHLKSGGEPPQSKGKAGYNTARPQRPPRPVSGLCAAGQPFPHTDSSSSFRFARISA